MAEVEGLEHKILSFSHQMEMNKEQIVWVERQGSMVRRAGCGEGEGQTILLRKVF